MIIQFRISGNTVLLQYYTITLILSLPEGPRLCLLHWKSVLHPYYISPSPQALSNSSRQAKRGSVLAYYHMFKINTVYTTVCNLKPRMPNDFAAVMMVEEITE